MGILEFSPVLHVMQTDLFTSGAAVELSPVDVVPLLARSPICQVCVHEGQVACFAASSFRALAFRLP